MNASSPFPPSLRFVHPWRPYQARLLTELEPHMSDARLHVVAAPGAGKTVLGLEVLRRLGRRALVVTPTITIRNQWAERFRSGFRADGEPQPALIGERLGHPSPITVTTYQALHAAANGGSAPRLPSLGTLVLDEAHHLRNEWWKVLVGLVEQVPGLRVVSLTATPPFDVSAAQWNRYVTLCGPIDAEISVPELVAAGNLCPHQDLVHLSAPTATEWQTISAHRREVARLRSQMLDSTRLLRAVLGHPHFVHFDTDPHREAVLGAPEVFSAMVVFAVSAGHACTAQREFLGVGDGPVPALDDGWLEILLTDFLFTDPERYDADEGFRREVERDLRRAHAVERRRVQLDGGAKLARQLRASDNKVESVRHVFQIERSALGSRLRLVVLTDHVRKEFLGALHDAGGRVPLGAVPIFEALATDRSHDVPLCLLTGGLVIVPRSVVESFAERLAARGVESPREIPHPIDLRYVLVPVTDSLRQVVVHAVTELFDRGAVKAIVGTAALLAEGWDAQAANTLIIASAVSTQMLGNQMRGRVIRVDSRNPDKASNIWHLACVEPGAAGGGADFATVRRRFGAFEGVSRDGTVIESGFARMFEPPPRWSSEDVERINRDTLARAHARESLAGAWDAALDLGTDRARHGLVEEIRQADAGLRERYASRHPRGAALRGTAITTSAGAGVAALSLLVLEPALAIGLGVAVVAALAASLRLPARLARAWRALRIGWGPELIASVGDCLLDTLSDIDALDSPRSELDMVARSTDRDEVIAHVPGATRYESDQLVLCLEEILAPVDNPRYLLVHLGEGQARHYQAVPSMLGRKAAAETLARHWRRRIGACELVYTRTAEGRLALLRARASAWSRPQGACPERVNCWR